MAVAPTGFLLPLLYSEFFGAAPTRDDLTSFVRQIEWRALALQIIGILSVSAFDSVEDPAHQRMLVEEMTTDLLYAPAIAIKLNEDHKRRLFTREGLLAVLRVAIIEGSAGGVQGRDYSDAFARAALAANELLLAETTPVAPTGTAIDLLPTELRSNVLHLENPNDLLARTDALFAWNETPTAQGSPNALSLAADFHRFTGFTPREFAAGAYALYARFAGMERWEQVMHQGVAFSLAQWPGALPNPDVLRRWVTTNSVPIEKVRAEWRAESSLSLAAAGTLWRCPVIRAEDDLFFVPAPALVQNAMGDGAYFALLDGYREAAGADPRARKEAVERFTRLYGEFFEDNIADIFERAYAGRDGILFTREIEYLRGIKSSDVVIAEGNDMLFIEIVAKRMNLRDSVLRLQPTAIAADLQAGVFKKARELDRNIKDFRDGKLLPDWPRPDGQRIFPLIVAPNDWPRINLIATKLDDLAQDGLLVGCEPLELLDLGEVERLERGLSGGLLLSGLLDRKNRSARHNRMLSVHNYLIYIEPNLLPNRMSPTRERGSAVAGQVIELARSWGAT